MEDYLLAVPDIDDLAAELVVDLPAMSGGSPGVLDDIVGGGWDWVKGQTVDPVYDYLAGKVADIIRQLWSTLSGVVMSLAWSFYKFLRDTLYFFMDPQHLFYFPPAEWLKATSPAILFGKIINMVYEAVSYKVWQLVTWLKDQVVAVVGGAGGLVGDVGGWIVDQVRSVVNGLIGVIEWWAKWVWTTLSDQVGNGINYVVSSVSWVFVMLRDQIGNGINYAVSSISWVFVALRDQIGNGINYVVTSIGWVLSSVTGLLQNVLDVLSDLGQWIYDNIGRPLLDGMQQLLNTLVAGAESVFNTLIDALQKVLIGPVDALVDTANAKLAIPGKLLRGEYDSLDAFVDDITDPLPIVLAGLVGVILVPFIISLVTSSVMTTLVEPLLERPVQEARQKLGDRLLTVDDITEAWNREFIPEGHALELLGRHGYGGQSLEAVQKLRFRLPPLTDLIRMAVKEVFTPDLRASLTLDAEYPGVLTEHARAIGLDEEWAQNYWAGHWDLPSPTQGYTMLHRGIIDPGQLANLLKALDYAPVWRQRLQDISYNPLTRVDIRRLYRARILDEAAVFKAYKDIGYNDANAQYLTEFTRVNYAPDDRTSTEDRRDLTASSIRLAYRRKLIDRTEAADRLVEIGYDEAEAEFQLAIDDDTLARNPVADADVDVRELSVAMIRQAYRDRLWDRDRAAGELEVLGYLPSTADLILDLEDLAAARDLTEAEVSFTRQRFVAFDITQVQADAELADLQLAPERRQLLTSQWAAEREAGTRKLTVANVFRALALGVFNSDQALAYLLRIGYSEADAGVLMQLRAGA